MTEAHIRIDEGIKRGPRLKPPAKAPRKAVERPGKLEQGKLANLNVQPILERYIAGASSTEIAKDLGVTRQGLAWWMRKHAEEDWKEAQVIQAVERKEKAESELETATDALSLARGREQLRSAQWDLERVCSRIFGVKQEVTVDINHHISVDQALSLEAGKLADRIRGVAPMPNAALLPSILDVEQVDDSE